ncbi:hypothetical protein LINGRAHAP2_LOCUS24527 [Linum grandiflorum]
MRPIQATSPESQQSGREERVFEDSEEFGAQGGDTEREQHGLQLQRVCGLLERIHEESRVSVEVSGFDEFGVQREGERREEDDGRGSCKGVDEQRGDEREERAVVREDERGWVFRGRVLRGRH